MPAQAAARPEAGARKEKPRERCLGLDSFPMSILVQAMWQGNRLAPSIGPESNSDLAKVLPDRP